MIAETIITKEFAPEQAGERVGWVSVGENSGTNPTVTVDMVVATVGENGARYGYQERLNDQEQPFALPSEEGFVAISGIFLELSREQGAKQPLQMYYKKEERHRESDGIVQKGASSSPSLVSDEDLKQWADNPAELLGLLKQGLQGYEARDQYPIVYYLLNGMMGHERYHSQSSAHEVDPRQLFVVDKEMADTTSSQASIAARIVAAYGGIKEDDEKMQRGLTVFSDIPADEVPKAFQESRRKVAEKEQFILEIKDDLYGDELVFIPIGFRPNGRSWPYMDALGKDEEAAFGRELKALRSENIDLARHEIDRELGEVDLRATYASQGSHVLHLLAMAERVA
jgi:hypothetical protein